jgi:hypothetical protein
MKKKEEEEEAKEDNEASQSKHERTEKDKEYSRRKRHLALHHILSGQYEGLVLCSSCESHTVEASTRCLG